MRTIAFPTSWRTSLRLVAVAVTLAGIPACSEGPLSPSADVAGSTGLSAADAAFAKAPQLGICHSTGSGDYVLISINANAAPAHLEHGDAAPGDAVPDGSGATFSPDCVPQTVDVTGTYVLQSVGGDPLPALGTGEILYAATLVLSEGGACSLSITSDGNPDAEILEFTFPSCGYSVDGAAVTLTLSDGEEAFDVTLQWTEGQLILQLLIWNDGDPTDEGHLGDAVFVKV